MNVNTIYNENCLDTMARMPAGFIDLTVTSPPYDNLRSYNGYSFDFEATAKELYRVTKAGGVVVWVVSDGTVKGSESLTSFKQAIFFKEVCGFNVHDTMIYKAKGTGAKGSNKAYWQEFEFMFVLSKGQPKSVNRIADKRNSSIGLIGSGRLKKDGIQKNERPHHTKEIGIRGNVWEYLVGFMDNSDSTTHPAPFPEKLARDHVYSWSNKGDLVYDPFMGSGTTAKMAHLLGRDWIGSEISAEYVELANKRLDPYLRQLQMFT